MTPALVPVLATLLLAAPVIAGFALAGPAPACPAVASPPVVFRNVKILPMTSDEVLADRVVVVKDGTIARIGPADSTEVPEGATVIDGQGGTLIPGLIDLHTHVHFPEDLRLYLAHGVTTVLNLDGDPGVLEWRRELGEGSRQGPRLLSCGPHVLHVKTPEEAAATVASIAARGYDCVKVYDDVTAEAFRALVAAAHEKRLFVIGHIPRNLRWEDAMEARPDAIAHVEEFLYSPVLDGDEARIAEQMKAGSISLVATLACYDTITRQIANLEEMLESPDMRRLSPLRTRAWGPKENTYRKRFDAKVVPEMRWRLAFLRDLVGTLGKAGVRVLAGTDAGGPPLVFPGTSLIQEIESLVAAGLSPYQALRAATADAAAFLGMAGRLGTLEPGKDADLVLVRANPLLNIANLELQAGVMARGRWFSQDDLRADLKALESIFEDERRFLAVRDKDGLDAALSLAPKLRFSARGINDLGYQYLLGRKEPRNAVRIFELYVRKYPSDWNAYDSLSEALEAAGRKQEAVEACRKSLRLNASNDACRERIERLSRARGRASRRLVGERPFMP